MASSSRDDSRLTFDPAPDFLPIWSPDGTSIVFTSNRGGYPDLYRLAIAGVPSDVPLLKSKSRKSPTDWSRDLQFIVYTNEDSKTQADLWVLPLGGDKRPFPYLASQFNEGSGRLSPDGQWMGYVSDESGRDEETATRETVRTEILKELEQRRAGRTSWLELTQKWYAWQGSNLRPSVPEIEKATFLASLQFHSDRN